MRVIGDIHGDLALYEVAIRGQEKTVQIGDFGRGFFSSQQEAELDAFFQENPGHRFIRGNHDSPDVCRASPGWIPDGSYDPDTETMYIGGAWSIDHAFRTPGLNWWADEELSMQEIARIHADFVYFKPKIVITHDCPATIAKRLFIDGRPGMRFLRTRTGEAFEAMLRDHRPDVWVFGHWHETASEMIEGTEFICVDQRSFITL